MSHIVVLGAGLGGLPATYDLRAALDKKHQVTLVNANEFFQFVPSNPWVAVGWRTREQITFELEPYLRKKGINFIAQFVEKLDPENNQLILKNGETVEYDYLLITTGPRLAFEEVPGTGLWMASPSQYVPSIMPKKLMKNFLNWSRTRAM